MGKPKAGQKSGSKVERANTGNRGSKKNPQSHLNLILLGKGSFQATKSVNTTPWRGASDFSNPFDAVQAKKNREAGFC